MRRETVNLLIGMASGLAAGIASTLLLAPMTGSETRGRVRNAMSKVGRAARERASAQAEQAAKRARAAARRAERRRAAKLDHKLDLNTATREELTQLVGVGPSSANEIVKYRAEHGGFRSVDELDEVYGFGEAASNRIKDQVYVSETPEAMSI